MIWFRYWFVRLMTGMAAARLRQQPVDAKQYIIRPTPDMRLENSAASGLGKLEGATNFRDIGGYRAHDGRVTAYGKVFRSGDLGGLTERDLDYVLNTLCVKFICDLRNPEEIDAAPNRIPANAARYLSVPVMRASAAADERGMMRALISGDYDKIDEAFGKTYLSMIDTAADSFGQVLKALADPANLPAVIHCTAGKDRTGITIALLLALLGVPDLAIIADYSLTNLAFDRVYATASGNKSLTATGMNPAILVPILVAKPQWIDGVLRYVRRLHGSVERYATTACGLTYTDIEKLRAYLLE